MDLVGRVERSLRQEGLLRPGERVAVACSGGADSVALLLLLNELKQELGLRLLVAHLNHQLRGEESNADEAFVCRLADRLGLEFIGRREDVATRGEKQRMNLEEVGRKARLEFFTSLMTAGKADVVAVAHTLDDQAETVLARLLRGAGTRGLAGIYPVVELGKGRMVRPLLGVRRAALREFLAEREQSWREDASNLDRRRLRNRIRLELLPQLNPAALEHVARLARQAREEESYWSAVVEARFRRLVSCRDQRCEVSVQSLLAPSAELARLPERAAHEAQRALARRLVRRALRAVRGDLRRVTQTHVESVLRLAEAGQSGRRVELPGAVVAREFDLLVFEGQGTPRAAPAPYELEMKQAGALQLPGGGALELKLVGVAHLESRYNVPTRAADADRVRFPLVVRTWRPGDRFQPVGARRRRKLKELFQQKRVPVGDRQRLPLLVSGGEIAWVARLGVAAGCALGPESRTALLIEESGE